MEIIYLNENKSNFNEAVKEMANILRVVQCQGRNRKPHAEHSPKGAHRTGEDCERSDPLTPLGKNKLWLCVIGRFYANRTEPSAARAGFGAAPQGLLSNDKNVVK